MPVFPNDVLDPDLSHGDLLVQISTVDQVSAIHALRYLQMGVRDGLRLRWLMEGFARPDVKPDPRPHDDAQPAGLQGRDGQPGGRRDAADGRARVGRTGRRRARLGGRGLVRGRAHHPHVRRALGSHRPIRAGGHHRPDQADRRADGPRPRGGRARLLEPTPRARPSRWPPTSGWPTRARRRPSATASCAAATRSRVASTPPACSTRASSSSPTSATSRPAS